jgi:hypothetical protein
MVNDAWSALTKYKLLSDRVKALKTEVWLKLPPNLDADVYINELEEELQELKVWIDLHFDTKRMD